MRPTLDHFLPAVGAVVILVGVLSLMVSKRHSAGLIGTGILLVALPSLINSDLALLVILGGGAVLLLSRLIGSSRGRGLGCVAVLGGAALLVSSVLLGGAQDPGGPPKRDNVEECRDIAFVGLRGSGQRRDEDDGYGEQVSRLRALVALGARSRGLSFANLPVDYTAEAVTSDGEWSLVKDLVFNGNPRNSQFMTSAKGGADLARSEILVIRSRCGTRTVVVLAGYSQGALAAHAALAELAPKERAIVGSTVLLADPLRPPGTPNPRVLPTAPGRGVARLLGAVPHDELERWDRPLPHLHSWCLRGDPVCGLQTIPIELVHAKIHTNGYQRDGLLDLAFQDVKDDLGW